MSEAIWYCAGDEEGACESSGLRLYRGSTICGTHLDLIREKEARMREEFKAGSEDRKHHRNMRRAERKSDRQEELEEIKKMLKMVMNVLAASGIDIPVDVPDENST